MFFGAAIIGIMDLGMIAAALLFGLGPHPALSILMIGLLSGVSVFLALRARKVIQTKSFYRPIPTSQWRTIGLVGLGFAVIDLILQVKSQALRSMGPGPMIKSLIPTVLLALLSTYCLKLARQGSRKAS